MELREILDELAKTNSTAGLGRFGDFMKIADPGLSEREEPVPGELSGQPDERPDGEKDGGEPDGDRDGERAGGRKAGEKRADGRKAGEKRAGGRKAGEKKANGKRDGRKKTGAKKSGRRKEGGERTGRETDAGETGGVKTAGDREQPAAEAAPGPLYKETAEPVDLEKMMAWSMILGEPVSRKRRRRRSLTWRSE